MPVAKGGEINLSYKVSGKGQPLILINGFGGTQNALFAVVRAFAKHYRVVTFDNRGSGGSDKPTGLYSVRTMAGDTIGLMDFLGIEKAHLVGMSMGGMIAQEIAIDHPQRLDKLVLCSTSAGGQPFQELWFDLIEASNPGWNRSESDLAEVDLRKLIGAGTPRLFNRPFNRLVIATLASLMLRLRMTGVPVGQLEAMMSHDALDRLDKIQAPTLILAGSKDELMPPHSGETLASHIRSAKLVIIEGGAHAWQGDMPGRFNREVLSFLKGQ
jgi:3-oxoadipate enol-lactonase